VQLPFSLILFYVRLNTQQFYLTLGHSSHTLIRNSW